MDQWMVGILQGILPDNLLHFLHQHILHPQAPIQTLRREATRTINKGAASMYPLVEPLIDRVTRALYNSPDILVLAFVLVVLVLVFQVLAWLKRAMMWWTRLALRMVFWAVIIGLVAAVWQRGIEASLRDAVVVGGKITGYAAVVKDIWVREYQRYEAQAQQGARGRPGAARGRYGR